ncbi:autophagy-related protein 27 [Xylariaceae sp. AK1471]|nr:autophagy-related protein 27 [Xylariaceae sp. AK1471]
MKFSTIPNADAALLLSLLLAPLPATAMLDCKRIVADDQKFDLGNLGGPHSVVTSWVDGASMHNTTYTVDICRALKKKGDAKKGEECPNYTRVCRIKRLIKPGEKVDTIDRVTPLAGELGDYGGGPLDNEESRISKIDPDSGKEGLRVILKGGFRTTKDGIKRKQQAVIDFVCNKDRNGTEGEYDSEDKYDPDGAPEARASPLLYRSLATRADDNDEEDDTPSKEVQLGIEKDPSLVFDRYGVSDSDTNVDVLHLTWSSKYACESKVDDGSDGKKPSSHWGVFTWIVILVFLGTAAYLIFGSWLNYNRYGARGWDLLPHGDTIRDIPYLMKEWARRVLNTVQGSGSRGGYSAV